MIPCEEQPGGIIWENVHITWKTRWLRYVVQILFLFVIVFAGFLFISFLNITTPPLNNNQVDTSAYDETNILTATSNIQESWCLKNEFTVDAVVALCQPFLNQYYAKLGITVAIAVGVVMIKFLMRLIVLFLARFQRYKTHTEQSSDMIINLFVMYTVTTIIIIFLVPNHLLFIVSSQYLHNFFQVHPRLTHKQ